MKIYTLINAKMLNLAILGLLKVLGAPSKSLLYVHFRNDRAKIHILTFIPKKGVLRLKNAILKIPQFHKIGTHSSGM